MMQEELVARFRLSPQQERLWSVGRNGAAYRAQCALDLAGPLDAGALASAVEDVVARHEILRTAFPRVPGLTLPLQEITERSAGWDEPRDISALDARRQEAEIDALLALLRARRQATEEPTLRAALLKLAPERHALLLDLPALCLDSDGLDKLAAEVGRAYASRAGQAGGTEAEDPLQYADVADWLNELLEAEDTEVGRDYWRGQDVAAALTTRLGVERGATAGAEFEPRAHAFALPAAATAALEALALREGASLESCLLACWQIMLARHTGRPETVAAVRCDGRRHEELADALGLLEKYLPVRGRVAEAGSFSELVRELDAACREARRWQESFKWELLGGADAGEAGEIFLPFAFEFTRPAEQVAATGIIVSVLRKFVCTERFKLKLAFEQRADTLAAILHYDGLLFEASSVERLAAQLCRLAESAAAGPQAPPAALEILGDEERRLVLREFNPAGAPYANDKCLHHLFEEQAARTPDSTALVFEDESLTYRELNERSNRLARRLLALGVGADSLVGVCVERSVEMVVALLGVMKAGGAYVPLDPSYPQERLAFMLEDSRPQVLLTQEHLSYTLPEREGMRMLLLDRDWEEVARESAEPTGVGVSNDGLAYCIYTSGSTGRPKGVLISHRGICNRLLWMQSAFPLTASDRLLQKTPYSFDASVWELFVPLMSGAALVMARPGGHQDSAYLVRAVAEQKITVLQLVPSMLQVVLGERGIGECDSLRRVYCGGEVLPASLQERFHASLGAELHNLYGPTEVSIDATHWTCARGDERRAVPIGRPLSNVQVYLLDADMNPVPVGVAGELYVGGDNLARGYLNRPALTAERFVPNPFSNEPGARLYRTGDLARHLPGGEIEYLGRVDHQVKVRGFRIELGEIEAALRSHPSARDAVVLAREEESGEKRLIAYVVADAHDAAPDDSDDADALTIAALREYVAERLPEYMMPSAFLLLDTLPALPNGKVDRHALLALEVKQPERGDGAAPRTPVEEVLCAIWAEVLGVERVGVEDNFFDLGGHSLLVTQVVSRARQVFEVELPLRSLFETPTVAGLAATVEQAIRESGGGELQTPPLIPTPRGGHLPLSFAQQRLWFLDQLEPGSAAYNIPAAVRLRGALDVDALRRSLDAVAARHESLRTTFCEVNGEPVQLIHEAAEVALPVIDMSHLPEREREAKAKNAAKAEAALPFDLSRGPLLRAGLLRLAEAEHVLLLTMHHIISDGWSVGVLVNEVSRAYEAFAGGGEPSPSELPVQYADYAAWQRGWMTGDVVEGQLAYWRSQLAGAQAALDLPTDRPRPAVQTFNGATHRFMLPKELSGELQRLSRQEGVTLFMTLLAAFQTLLYRYTSQEDISVGAPVAGRTRVETEGLIGFFVNTLVMRARLDEGMTFRELLEQVRRASLSAYAHQDVPFERLVGELHPERDLSRTPLFQVMFSLQNAPEQAIELPGLRLSHLVADGGASKYDLTLAIEVEPEGLFAMLEYNADLFDAQTVERMAGHYARLLEAATEAPDLGLSELRLMPDAELRQLTHDWNETATAYSSDKCFHHLFEGQAARTPDSTAVTFEGESLSYRELNERANRLARRLLALGVGADSLVGVCVERSVEMVVALLGVMKAGGAYVPLDPSYPQERLAFMLEDSAARVLVTQRRLLGALPAVGAQVLCLDDAQEDGDGTNLDVHVMPWQVAYTIYTSGSTGRPKGVQVPHRALTNFLETMRDEPGMGDSDVLVAVTSLSFDIAALELYLPLTLGARLVLASRDEASDARLLSRLLSDSGATVMQATPSTWSMLLDSGWRAQGLKALCGGEALPKELASRLVESGARLWNMYGPTETTIWSSAEEVSASDIITIGRPIANTRLYVVDERMRPAPVGVSGELLIGGDGLARGYLKRPALTAEKFIPDPFSGEAGARLYRTGDVARRLADGRVECMGRNDEQVKIRGHRIELGEVEAALESHPQVGRAVAAAKGAGGGRRLVAYVVCAAGAEVPGAAELRGHVRARLPEYMAPSAFVVLDALPLTPNGKVDRKGLPEPEVSGPAEESYVAPRNSVEEVLCAIWAEVLGVERVGVEDNFFDLGGHSLLVTQAASRVRSAFGVELPPRKFFEAPTVAAMAGALVASEQRPGQTEKLAHLRIKLAGMSAEEVEALLRKKNVEFST
jgi:amino acid adenylation domain-containing protein